MKTPIMRTERAPMSASDADTTDKERKGHSHDMRDKTNIKFRLQQNEMIFRYKKSCQVVAVVAQT